MGARNGAGAGSKERSAQLEKVLLGGGNNSQAKPHPRKKQVTNVRAESFSRTQGPRLAVPGWHSIAAALAREPQVSETAMQAAMRRAFEQGEWA